MTEDENTSKHPARVADVQNRFPEGEIGEGRFHESDVRVGIAAALFLALIVSVGMKLHYASGVDFKETCSIDQFFDPITAGIAGALTTILGFYFGERRRR